MRRQRITEVLLWTLGYLHAHLKPSSVQPKAPWHGTAACSPLMWAHPLYHPQKQSETISKKRAHEHGSAQATQHEAGQNQHCCAATPGKKQFEHDDPYYPQVSRESGKCVNRGYKQHNLGNYMLTGIYYLETMSGITLPGKFRLQSK